jgi:hypothetical protein
LGIKSSPGALGKNYPFLAPPTGRLNIITNILDPDSQYDSKRKKGRKLQNLVDYREFIKKGKI